MKKFQGSSVPKPNMKKISQTPKYLQKVSEYKKLTCFLYHTCSPHKAATHLSFGELAAISDRSLDGEDQTSSLRKTQNTQMVSVSVIKFC